ncbi:MAG: glycosyltransferase family 4 protein, partial [bacterium]|nr:glycosyltransferase family 4 protein [bacterium]
EALKLKNILIYDALPHKQALAVVQHADLSILPFKKGVCDLCLPLKFFESLALGTPVLVCNGDEVEIIVGQSGSGAVFDSNQPRQLTEIIESYTQQPQLLKSQGEKGSKFIVENYNRTLMAKKYLELFTTLINK